MYLATTALKKIRTLRKRIWVVQGGTSASKTVSILLILIHEAQTRKVAISVVSESLPHLKRGALKDFLSIMEAHNYYQEERYNRTDRIYTFETGATIEFFGADQPDKVRGPRRDVLFINECNNVPYGVFDQMEVRTKERVILDFNPVGEFWVHTEVMPTMEHDFLKLTYLDNEALDPQIKASIESRKHNASWWKVYGLGEIGVKEGQVYDDWRQIPEVPEEAVRVRRWLDFGFTNDPTAIGSLFTWGHNDDGVPRIIVDEEEYRTGMVNSDIAAKLKGLDEPETLVVADSQEQKSIEEIKRAGFRQITGAIKGPGSINFGIDTVHGYEVYYTARSHNIRKEKDNYLWKLGKDGKPLNTPEDLFNHHMDGIRYAVSDYAGNPKPTDLKQLVRI